MKRILLNRCLHLSLAAVCLISLAGMANAQEREDAFEGFYTGGKTGCNQVSWDGFDSTGSWTLGVELGYMWQSSGGFVFGLDGYYDYNAATGYGMGKTDYVVTDDNQIDIGSQAYGMDTLYGFASNDVLHFAKLGTATSAG